MATIVRSKDIAITNLGIPQLYVPRAPETTALLAAMAVQPSSTAVALINKTVLDLKAAGLWTKARALLFPGLPTQQAGLLDWKDPLRAAPVIQGGVAYNPRGALVPDGATGWLDLGFSAASLGLTQNNIAVSTRFGEGSGPLFGTREASGELLYASASSGGNLTSRINQSGPADGVGIPAQSGHVIVSRSTGSGYSRYFDGLSLGDAAGVSTGVASNNMVLFRFGTSNGSRPISHHGVFTALTAADAAALTQIVNGFVERIATI